MFSRALKWDAKWHRGSYKLYPWNDGEIGIYDRADRPHPPATPGPPARPPVEEWLRTKEG